ncbi:MAG: PBSX family phage terminase large subunit [Oscillospiraceae bacterium]|nr:PBSX family phage terminase large subunit [Oscillospiraceae bacterium]
MQSKLGRVAAWYAGLRDGTNETFLPLYFDKSRYLVLMGGGGSGKSVFAGRKILERAAREPGHRLLVCRKVARTLKESCFRQLCGQAAQHYKKQLGAIRRSEPRISMKNGSEILFAGLDDPEKLKSIYNITGLWIEEASELSEAGFDQLDLRLRGQTRHYKQMILSFNPVSLTHWLKARFFDPPGGARPGVRLHHSTYRDNRFLDGEYRRVLEGFRDTDEYYYDVYCLGRWGSTGRSVFNAAAVRARLEEGITPLREGQFALPARGLNDIEFCAERGGPVKIYAMPGPGRPYVIGADTAGDGSDSFAGQVVDNITGRQVAVLRQTFDEDVFARQLGALGRFYNDALIGVETNFSTYPVRELERLGYPNLYVREETDTYTRRPRPSYGVRTTALTRPVMIAGLIAALREDISLVSDETTLQEMLTFVRSESLRPEAARGAHDDCVMALAIAHFIRPQMRMTIAPPAQSLRRWTEDMWEDYEAAGAEGRAYLREKWGKEGG